MRKTVFKRLFAVIFALLMSNTGAFATYTATNQPCELSPTPGQVEVLAICSVTIGDADVEIALLGKWPNKVSEVRFLQAGQSTPRQTLKLSVTPLIDPETVAIMVVDFNFDGYEDFAIMPSIQTSENVKYLYFLYNPDTGRFQASPAMSEIFNPVVITAKKHIRSYWRETPARSGWNLWKWKRGIPFIATRIEQSTGTGAGNASGCLQTITRYGQNGPQKSAPTPC